MMPTINRKLLYIDRIDYHADIKLEYLVQHVQIVTHLLQLPLLLVDTLLGLLGKVKMQQKHLYMNRLHQHKT
jgi:hypothetical protein